MFPIANPRQAILVTSRAEVEIIGKRQQKDNIFTLTWHTPLSASPKLYGIVISKSRFSYKLISKSKVFVVNFMPAQFSENVLFCGRNTGELLDKFKETGLTKIEAEAIDCAVIGEACGYLECEVIDEFETGDHMIIVGKVLREKEGEECKRIFYSGMNRFTTTKI